VEIDWEEQKNSELFDYYHSLIHLRKEYPALRSKNIEVVPNGAKTKVLSFYKTEADQKLLVILNMGGDKVKVKLQLNEGTVFKSLLGVNREYSAAELSEMELQPFQVMILNCRP